MIKENDDLVWSLGVCNHVLVMTKQVQKPGVEPFLSYEALDRDVFILAQKKKNQLKNPPKPQHFFSRRPRSGYFVVKATVKYF